MLCQECKKNNAVYFYSENVNGKTYSVALCEECKKRLANKGSGYPSESEYNVFDSFLFPSPFGFSLLNGNVSHTKRCSECNSSFDELVRGKRGFCPKCYEIFHSELSSLLTNIHGSDRHTGKRPVKSNDTEEFYIKKEEKPEKEAEAAPDTVSSLKEDLKRAIAEEKYEDAAKIRDEIKRLEEEK